MENIILRRRNNVGYRKDNSKGSEYPPCNIRYLLWTGGGLLFLSKGLDLI